MNVQLLHTLIYITMHKANEMHNYNRYVEKSSREGGYQMGIYTEKKVHVLESRTTYLYIPDPHSMCNSYRYRYSVT